MSGKQTWFRRIFWAMLHLLRPCCNCAVSELHILKLSCILPCRWAGSWGIDADFVAKSKCSLISISAEDLKVPNWFSCSQQVILGAQPSVIETSNQKCVCWAQSVWADWGWVPAAACYSTFWFYCYSSTSGERLLLLESKSGAVKRNSRKNNCYFIFARYYH